MAHAYPLSYSDDRRLPEDYSGNVYIWDVDKTYLSTHFSSMKGLARIPVEFAIDKKAIAGMPEVLRGLRRGPGPGYAGVPLYFISASPPFLRKVLQHKMLLDGVEQDGITFKDWVGTLLQLKPGRLFEQVGYKITALLTGRVHRPLAVEYLFGDDTERDAQAFTLYARFVNGLLSTGDFEKALEKSGVPWEDRQGIHALAGRLPEKRGRVERIFIHLEYRTPPKEFEKYGKILQPVKGGFQLALALFEGNLVDADAVVGAQRAVSRISRHRFGSVKELLKDAQKRHLISPAKFKKLKAVMDKVASGK